jgi:hypothetical protein
MRPSEFARPGTTGAPRATKFLFGFAIALSGFLGGSALGDGSHPYGYFPERPQLEWLDDGRLMQLLRDFIYIDQSRTPWTAPKGAKTDGASIPPILWSFVGGPFEGQYRNAAIVHDTECDAKIHEWQAVHRMFYNASRAGGVGWAKASLMYAAVYAFGPHWKVVKPPPPMLVTPAQAQEYLTRVLVILRRNFATREITFQTLEQLSYADAIRQVPDADADLARVRSLLAERVRLSTGTARDRVFAEGLTKLDAALYYADQKQPDMAPDRKE